MSNARRWPSLPAPRYLSAAHSRLGKRLRVPASDSTSLERAPHPAGHDDVAHGTPRAAAADRAVDPDTRHDICPEVGMPLGNIHSLGRAHGRQQLWFASSSLLPPPSYRRPCRN